MATTPSVLGSRAPTPTRTLTAPASLLKTASNSTEPSSALQPKPSTLNLFPFTISTPTSASYTTPPPTATTTSTSAPPPTTSTDRRPPSSAWTPSISRSVRQ